MNAGRELDAKVAEALGWYWGDTGQGLVMANTFLQRQTEKKNIHHETE